MPFGLMAGQAALNLGGTLFQQSLNEKNYNRQRQDALTDYNAQLEYNKPINQIGRLQEAGISPYANSSQSLLASAPTPRSSSMPQTNTNKPMDLLAMKQGMEQVKLLQLQQRKVMADTANVDADTNNKKLEYDTNIDDWNDPKLTGILAKRKHFDLDNILAMINKNSNQASLAGQQTSNAAAQFKGIRANSEIAAIEKLFRSQLLQGKADVLQGQIGMYKNKNYRDSIQNYYANKDFSNISSTLQSTAEIRKQEAELANVIPASMRYFLEKMGGNRAIGSGIGVLLRRLLFR